MEELHHWRDFVALPEDDRRELVDGQLLEIEMPKKWHENIVAALIVLMRPWGQRHGLRVLGSGFKVRISDVRGVMPDVQVLTEEVYEAASDDGLEEGHPELVVEVISPTGRAHDRVRKLNWYAAIGVPEYWLIDADAQTVERLVLHHGVYRIEQVGTGDDVFRPRSMRGLKIPLADLWPKPRRKS
jgi:Uma2 family endonuclease